LEDRPKLGILAHVSHLWYAHWSFAACAAIHHRPTTPGVAVLTLSPLYRGITTYIMQGFNLPQFCKIIEQESITVAYIVPPVALALVKVPIVDSFNLKSLRFMHPSAAPTPKEIIVAVGDRLGVPV
jgi:4-coumarate--CoA ligase